MDGRAEDGGLDAEEASDLGADELLPDGGLLDDIFLFLFDC